MSSPAWKRRRRNVEQRLVARRFRHVPQRWMTSAEAFRAYEQPIVDLFNERRAALTAAFERMLRS